MRIFRKAMVESFMGITIFGVIVLIVLLGLSSSMINTAKDVSKREICKRSVEYSSSLYKMHVEPEDLLGKINYVLSDPFGNPGELECSTNYINFKSDDSEVIKREIADEMVDCWELYGEGELEIFDTKDNNYCVVCSRLTFDEEVDVDHFTLFLKQNYAPVNMYKKENEKLDEEPSYWDYFMGVDIENFETTYYENSNLSKFDSFKTNFSMAVMYVMEKDAYPGGLVEEGKTAEAFKTGTLGAVGGAIAGVALCATGVGCGVVAVVYSAAVAGAAGGVLGTGAGYMMGSDRSSDRNTYILLWNYDDLEELPCTYLEAKSTPLEVVQK